MQEVLPAVQLASAVKLLLHVGALDPIDEISGLQARLRNLGTTTAKSTGDELLAAALAALRLNADLSSDAIGQTARR